MNWNDLTVTSLEQWFEKGIILNNIPSAILKFINSYNSARYFDHHHNHHHHYIYIYPISHIKALFPLLLLHSMMISALVFLEAPGQVPEGVQGEGASGRTGVGRLEILEVYGG